MASCNLLWPGLCEANAGRPPVATSTYAEVAAGVRKARAVGAPPYAASHHDDNHRARKHARIMASCNLLWPGLCGANAGRPPVATSAYAEVAAGVRKARAVGAPPYAASHHDDNHRARKHARIMASCNLLWPGLCGANAGRPPVATSAYAEVAAGVRKARANGARHRCFSARHRC